MAQSNRIRAQGNRLGHIGTIPDTTRINQRDLAALAQIINRFSRLTDRRDARHAGIFGGKVRTSSGAAFHTVDVNGIRIAFYCHPHVVIDSRRTQFQLYRNLPIRGFANFLDLQRQIIRTQPIRMPCRRPLVDTRRQRPHIGHLVGHFLAHQVTTQTNLTTLANKEFTAIRQDKVVRVEAIARLNALIEPLGRVTALIRDHTPLARARCRTGHSSSTGERRFGFVGQSPEAHPRHIDRNIQFQGAFRARANHRLGFTFLAIPFDHEPRQRARQKGQIIPMGDLLEQRKPPHPIPAKFGLDMDIVHDARWKNKAVTDAVYIAVQRFFSRATISHF